MYLKAIETVGFKSFANRTRLDFKPGVTGIVGPNGCGKCVSGNTLVCLSNGWVKPIRSLVEDEIAKCGNRVEKWDDGFCCYENSANINVLSVNLNTLKIESRPVAAFVKRTSPAHLFRMRTRSGREITATHYHPLFTIKDGRIESLKVEDIRPGMPVAVPRRIPVKGATVRFHPGAVLSAFKPEDSVYVPPSDSISKHLRGIRGKVSPDVWRQVQSGLSGQSMKTTALVQALSGQDSLPDNGTLSSLRSARGGEFDLPRNLDENLAKFLGYIVSEGRVSRSNQVWFVNSDPEIVRDFCVSAKKAFSKDVFVGSYKPPSKDCIIPSKALCLYLDRVFGLGVGDKSAQKAVPPQIFGSPDSVVLAFLSALFEGDGCLRWDRSQGKTSVYWEYCTASRKLANDVVTLLMRFGIFPVIRSKSRAATNTQKKVRRTYYSVYVYGLESAQNLARMLSFVGEKCSRVADVLALRTTGNPNLDLIPGVSGKVRSLVRTAGVKVKQVRGAHPKLAAYCENRCGVSRDGLAEVLEVVRRAAGPKSLGDDLNFLDKLQSSDIYWDVIESVEKVKGEEWVYDLCVEKTHNFVADNFFVHNSNIVDSIRWCIGEMSWKSLRSASMVDIIFGGTTNRPPLHMAEVSMIFDNESRRLPIDFPEVAVTRKIFRSGESEYFLNKVQCRLRDIREMFLDTGIGGEGYAVIDQGEVNFILEAKPEERRELFEEAAGVAKYKAKRDEALKKLDKVDLDLGRLADSIVLIEEQIKKLDSEARKARLHQKYTEELKVAEVAMLLGDMRSEQSEIEKENSELTPLKAKFADISRQISAAEGELSAVNLKLSEKQAEARQFGEKIAAIKYETARLDGKIHNCDQLTAEIQKHLLRLDEEDKTHSARLAEMDPEIQTARQRLDSQKNGIELMDTECAQQSSQVQSMEVEMSNLRKTLDSADSELMSMSQSEVDLSKQIATEESGLTHDREALINLARELKAQTARARALKGELESSKAQLEEHRGGLGADRNELALAEERKDGLYNSLQQLNARLSETKVQKSGAAARLESALAQGSKDSYWVGTQAVLNSGMQGVKGTLRQVIEAKSEDRLLVEEAFGRFLDSVVCDTVETANECIGYLQQLGKGRGRFLCLNAVPEVQDTSWGFPEGAKMMREKISCPAEYEPLVSYLLKSVFISNGAVRGPFWLCGGAENAASPQAYWEEEGELKLNIKSLDEKEAKILSDISACEKENEENKSALEALRERVNSKMLQEHSLSVSVTQNEETLGLCAQELELNANESEKTRREIESASNTLSSLQTGMQKVKSAQEERKREFDGFRAREDALQNDYSTAKEKFGAMRSDFENMRSNLQRLESDVARLEAEKNNLAAGIEKNAEDRKDSRDRIARLAVDKEDARAGLESSRNELAGQETREKRIVDDLDILKKDFNSRNSAISDRKSEVQELRDGIHEIELRINTLQTRFDDMTRRLLENWDLTPDAAREKYSNVDVDHDRVSMMRRRLENIGPVNMTAPEEYEALSARDNFLKGQAQDLQAAKSDLKSAISKINATTRENFRHTFNQVRDHFIRIYSILFEGGEADIKLTMPDNLLETGIEIFAQPPGKRLQNISQLSGGEKALTALALLFSFFCVNPSPFCILDEADAPLDEANIERFVGLVKEFSRQTQFIIITHSKRTMEIADVLYGVTMEQPGVSQIISMSLEEAAKTNEAAMAPEAVSSK